MLNTQNIIATPKTECSCTASVNKFDASNVQSIISNEQTLAFSKKADLRPSQILEKEKEIAYVIESVKLLENEHTNYSEQYVVRGNQALYGLLAKVYELAIKIDMSDNKDSILKSLRNAMSLQKKIKTQKNSTALTMIVRWVVGGSRQLAHTYSKALEAAYGDNIAASKIVEYFAEGGLNKAKKKQATQAEMKTKANEHEFKYFMRAADVNYKSFKNTKIVWTEEVFMDNSSGHVMILGHHSGGGIIQGYRAFNLSSEVYAKISNILANELFKTMREDEIADWVEASWKKDDKLKNKNIEIIEAIC